MDDTLSIHRELELGIGADELWRAVTDPSSLGDWFGDIVELDLRPGGAGAVVDDDGSLRRLVVTRVDEGRRLGFTWWRDDEPGEVSTIEIDVVPTGEGSRLVVHETFTGPLDGITASASTAWRSWGMRLLALWSMVAALACAAA